MFYKIKSCVGIGMDTFASFALSLWQEVMKKSSIDYVFFNHDSANNASIWLSLFFHFGKNSK